MMQPILFKGRKFILIDEGPIATAKQYVNGEVSYAHLQQDGRIMRHGEQIGVRADIEILGECEELEMKPEAERKMLEEFADIMQKRQRSFLN